LVQSLAKETAPHRINVNAICPGMFITNLRDHWIESGPSRLGYPRRSTTTRVREGQQGCAASVAWNAGDIANVVSFLVSRESDYMTGQTLNVCGGLVMN